MPNKLTLTLECELEGEPGLPDYELKGAFTLLVNDFNVNVRHRFGDYYKITASPRNFKLVPKSEADQ